MSLWAMPTAAFSNVLTVFEALSSMAPISKVQGAWSCSVFGHEQRQSLLDVPGLKLVVKTFCRIWGLSHVAYLAVDSLDCALPGRATERYSINHFGQVT